MAMKIWAKRSKARRWTHWDGKQTEIGKIKAQIMMAKFIFPLLCHGENTTRGNYAFKSLIIATILTA